jgi:hypothetical protein
MTQAHQQSQSQLRLYVYFKAVLSFLQLLDLGRALEKHTIELLCHATAGTQIARRPTPRMFVPTRSLQSITAVHPSEALSSEHCANSLGITRVIHLQS